MCSGKHCPLLSADVTHSPLCCLIGSVCTGDTQRSYHLDFAMDILLCLLHHRPFQAFYPSIHFIFLKHFKVRCRHQHISPCKDFNIHAMIYFLNYHSCPCPGRCEERGQSLCPGSFAQSRCHSPGASFERKCCDSLSHVPLVQLGG